MPFTTLSEVIAYIDTYIKTNGADSITGAQMNAALNGLAEFIQEALDGAGGASGTLQEVTDNGSTTTNEVTIGDASSSGNSVVISTDQVIAKTNTDDRRYIGFNPDTITFSVLNGVLSGTRVIQLLPDTLTATGTRTIKLPDDSGTLKIPRFGNKTASISGGTYAVTLDFTPTFVAITPKNADTATLVSGGYHINYGVTGFVVTFLSFAFAGTVNFDYVAYK